MEGSFSVTSKHVMDCLNKQLSGIGQICQLSRSPETSQSFALTFDYCLLPVTSTLQAVVPYEKLMVLRSFSLNIIFGCFNQIEAH